MVEVFPAEKNLELSLILRFDAQVRLMPKKRPHLNAAVDVNVVVFEDWMKKGLLMIEDPETGQG